jgi:hypothetical protein
LSGGKPLGQQATHGGKRDGAGRPRIWSFEDVLTVGQMCETRWREVEAATFKRNLNEMLEDKTELASLTGAVNRRPKSKRRSWWDSEGGEDFRNDIIEEIGDLNEEISGERSQNRVFQPSQQPPRGTRKQILEEAAIKFGIKVKTASNLWEAYRRFERE